MPPSLIEDFVKGFEVLDWDVAIRRNRDQLKTIILALFALARMRVGGSLVTLPRSTIGLIMMVLRPAESAVRRLIVIAAHGLKLSTITDLANQPGDWLFLSPTERGGEVPSACEAVRGSYRAFALFDPLKSFDPDSIWDAEPVFQSGYNFEKSNPYPDISTDHAPLDATNLAHRLNAILRALNDLPRQARRLKRWEFKRDAALKASKPTRFSPMRPGLPPGWRERKVHEIDEVLKECHRLANDRLDSG